MGFRLEKSVSRGSFVWYQPSYAKLNAPHFLAAHLFKYTARTKIRHVYVWESFYVLSCSLQCLLMVKTSVKTRATAINADENEIDIVWYQYETLKWTI